MIPLIPVVVGTGLVVAFVRSKKKKMTPERKKLFEDAIKSEKDPEKLNKLAGIFEKDGLRAEGAELRKRSKVISMPPAKKDEYRGAYKAGMKSTDPAKVKNLAAAFHQQGFYGSAKNLRDYAAGLVDNMKMHLPVNNTPPSQTVAHGLEGNYGGDTGVIETDAVEIVEGG